MKKKLDEILNGMTPSELDRFSREIGERELPEETLSSLKNKVLAKTGLKNTKKTTKVIWLRFTAAAACFCLVVAAVVALPRMLADGANTTDFAETERPLLWSDIDSFFGKKPSDTTTITEAVMVERVLYKITEGRYSEYKNGIVISEDYIGEKIDKITVRSGWYRYRDNTEYDVRVVEGEVYTIKGLPSEIAVAVRYLEEPTAGTTTHYYTYTNPSYYGEADSIAQLYELYNADEYLSVETFGLSAQIHKNGGDKNLYRINEALADELLSMILALDSSASYSEYSQENLDTIEKIIKDCKERLKLTLEIELLGKLKEVYVLDNGYVCFTGFTKGVMFFEVDKTAARSLIETVKNKAELYVPSYNDEGTVTHRVTTAADPEVNE